MVVPTTVRLYSRDRKSHQNLTFQDLRTARKCIKHLYDLRRKTRQGLIRHYAFIDYTYEPTGTSRYGNAVPYT